MFDLLLRGGTYARLIRTSKHCRTTALKPGTYAGLQLGVSGPMISELAHT